MMDRMDRMMMMDRMMDDRMRSLVVRTGSHGMDRMGSHDG